MTYEVDYWNNRGHIRTVLVNSDQPIPEVKLPFIVRQIVGKQFEKIRQVKIVGEPTNN